MSKRTSGIDEREEDRVVIGLVGNPNVGKSTLFNALTGRNQHTGNWPGKTVSVAEGRYVYKGKEYVIVDLPGTYSMISLSEEERVTAEVLSSDRLDCVLIVADGSCMERNLAFALQVLERANRVMLCVNLMDEAQKAGISIDMKLLQSRLGVPVVGTAAGNRQGLENLKETIRNLTDGFLSCRPLHVVDQIEDEEQLNCLYAQQAKELYTSCVKGGEMKRHWIDIIALSKWSGSFLLLALLFFIFWLTAIGANYPSDLLQHGFDNLGVLLRRFFAFCPRWLSSLLIDGIYATTANVVSVMLPPMLIFYPLFSLLEDAGFLPRAAFMTDHIFSKCGSCGKQSLTMAMGFGCNAVGVMGCRIIASEKERLLAIVTNALVPCNGRFPALITLSALLLSDRPIAAACFMTGIILLSIVMTLLSTALLGKTAAKKKESHFIMELPPYRMPRLGKIFASGTRERVKFVLIRAIAVSAPAGALIWCLQNITYHDIPMLNLLAAAVDPVGVILGMNGAILLAFLLSFPANELLLPLVVMITNGAPETVADALANNGWNLKMAICMILFVVFHWPCSTTCLTVYRETKSLKWTAAAILLPTAIGVFLCLMIGN